MRDLANQVIPLACPMWHDIGCQLKLSVATLNEIQANGGGVRHCCTTMFKEWLKQDPEASWATVSFACKSVKENLLSSPQEPHIKNHIDALNQLSISLPLFIENL